MMPLPGLAENAPRISASEAVAIPGERVTTDIIVENNPGINSLAIRIAYDKSNLTIVDTKDGGLFSGTDTTIQESPSFDADPYVIAWMCIENKNITKNGKLFSVTFEAAQNASFASCLIDLTVREAFDANGRAVSFDVADGAVYITPSTDHTVTFRDWDSRVLDTQSVAHGKAAHAPANPVREGYNFTGWDKDFSNVTADMDIYAQYALKTYTVTFTDWDGRFIANVEAAHGTAAQAPEDPVRTGYTFTGWDRDFSHVTSNMTVKAQYQATQCNVVFVDYDSSPILRVVVDYGTAAHAPADPVREGYTFTGWDKDFTHVTGDMTVKAQYSVNTYTFTYFVDGTLYTTQKYEYGQTVVPAPAPAGEGTFSGWSYIPVICPAENVNIYGSFNASYTVIFEDWDGTPLKVQQVASGESAQAPAVSPREGYDFTGWNRDFSSVTENMIVKAQYELKKFTVKFYDWDNTLLREVQVEWGKAAPAPAIPGRTGYKFTGWDKDISCIKADMTVKAQYVKAVCIVTFVDTDGTILDVQSVQYGQNATPPVVTPPTGYELAGWDKPYTNIVEDVTIQVIYREIVFTVTFKDMDGKTISTQEVGYGKAAQEPESKPYHEGYMFKGWDKDFSSVINDLTVNAMFVKCYKVTFVDTVANAVIEVQTVEQSASASAPKAPEHDGYTFIGWDRVFANVTSDITVKAMYDADAVTGDVNGDGSVNTADAVVILKYSAEMIQLDNTQLISGDTNHDSKVNTADAVLILKYAAGMITEF